MISRIIRTRSRSLIGIQSVSRIVPVGAVDCSFLRLAERFAYRAWIDTDDRWGAQIMRQ